MTYESKITYTGEDKSGNDKLIKESFIIEDAVSFCGAEMQTHEYCQGKRDLDITDIKRSKIREIANKRDNEEQDIYLAEIADTVFNDQTGEETELVYKIALFASNFDDAHSKMKEFIKQGYDMIITSVKKSKFTDIIFHK